MDVIPGLWILHHYPLLHQSSRDVKLHHSLCMNCVYVRTVHVLELCMCWEDLQNISKTILCIWWGRTSNHAKIGLCLCCDCVWYGPLQSQTPSYLYTPFKLGFLHWLWGTLVDCSPLHKLRLFICCERNPTTSKTLTQIVLGSTKLRQCECMLVKTSFKTWLCLYYR